MIILKEKAHTVLTKNKLTTTKIFISFFSLIIPIIFCLLTFCFYMWTFPWPLVSTFLSTFHAFYGNTGCQSSTGGGTQNFIHFGQKSTYIRKLLPKSEFQSQFSLSRLNLSKYNFHLQISTKAQYGHSQPKKKSELGDKYHRSIKAHTYLARRPRISINWNPPFQTSLHKISKEVFLD